MPGNHLHVLKVRDNAAALDLREGKPSNALV
jgi:hypothetical protein